MSSQPIFARDEHILSQQSTLKKIGQLVLGTLAVCTLSFLVAHATVRGELSGAQRAPGTATAHILVSETAGARVHAAIAEPAMPHGAFAPEAEAPMHFAPETQRSASRPQHVLSASAETVGTLRGACFGAESCINGRGPDSVRCEACKMCAATCSRVYARQCAYSHVDVCH